MRSPASMTLMKAIIRAGIVDERNVQRLEPEWKMLPLNTRPTFVEYVAKRLKLATDKVREIERIEQARQEVLSDRILTETLSDIQEGRAVLFVGAGFSLEDAVSTNGKAPRGLTGRIIQEDLAKDLKSNNLEPELLDSLSLGQTALAWERGMNNDRKTLNDALCRLCRSHLPKDPTKQHQLLAQIKKIRFIVTTNWDHLIEDSYADAGYVGSASINVITKDEQMANLDFANPTLVKIHGDLNARADAIEDLCITEDDFIKREDQVPAIFSLLRTLFLSHRVIVVGFDPQDYSLNRLVHFVIQANRNRDDTRKLVVVNPDPNATVVVPLDRPQQIVMGALRFMDVVNEYIENDGGSCGFARKASRHVGSAQVWAKRNCDLAAKVIDKYPNLCRVDVVSESSFGEQGRLSAATESVARRAAVVLKEVLRDEDSLSVSCGTTLRRMIEHLDPTTCHFRNVDVYASTIPLSDDSDVTSPFGLVSLFAHRFAHMGVRGHSYQLPASFADARVGRGMFDLFPHAPREGAWGRLHEVTATSAIDLAVRTSEEYIGQASDSRVICLGVGAVGLTDTSLTRYARACLRACHLWRGTNEEIARQVDRYSSLLMHRLGICGDVMYTLFRREGAGEFTEDEDWVFLNASEVIKCLKFHGIDIKNALFAEFLLRLSLQVLAISPDALRQAARREDRVVMLVGQGSPKRDAVHTLLEEEVANHLVVDFELANALLLEN